MSLKRRVALKAMVAAGTLLTTTGNRLAFSAATNAVFAHGVASGDPDGTSIVLWTRVSTELATLPVSWELSSDEQFSAVLAKGETMADSQHDHTVKVIVNELQPGHTYYYRFTAGDTSSPTGRTKTLPTGELSQWGIALASCSNYALGHFNAYDAIANDKQVDIVFHAGDYIYEYSTDGWGGDVARRLGRESLPDKEIISLQDYRTRHAQYKSDPGSQAMHAAHPFIACWDDHEVANNPWTGGAGNHQPETEGDWKQRRAAALQAYFEWMPIREPEQREQYWRTYQFGNLATMSTLESRHTGRNQEPPYPDWSTFKTMQDRDDFYNSVIADPNRKMLTQAVIDDVRNALKTSTADKKPWRIIGSASPMARFNIPDLGAMGITKDQLSEGLAYLADHGRWNWPWYTDTWDGYPVARQQFYTMANEAGARDLLVLTGDTHQFWASELVDDNGLAMGVELGTAGISSPSEYIDTGLDSEVGKKLDAIYEEKMPEVYWTNGFNTGYIRVVLTPTEARSAALAVDTEKSGEYTVVELFNQRIVKSENSLKFEV